MKMNIFFSVFFVILLCELASSQFMFPGPSSSGRVRPTRRQRISKTKCDEFVAAKIATAEELAKQGGSWGGVGGEAATWGEFPHMAAIGYPNSDRKTYSVQCGGSLISEFFVLTAAHCETSDDVRPTMVLLGELDLNRKEWGEVKVGIDEFIPHENYNSETRHNDIGLIRLEESVKSGLWVHPACLSQGKVENDVEVSATGWGYSSNDGHVPDVLQKMHLNTFGQARCQRAYSSFKITTSQVCAGVNEGGIDTCQGDSGGPLQLRRPERGIFKIIGVTSFGSFNCGQKGFPGVYTDVSSYLGWIEPKVWGV